MSEPSRTAELTKGERVMRVMLNSGSAVWHRPQYRGRCQVLRAVLDTNVLIAALRSSSGASYQLLLAADRGDFQVARSVPLLAEYDDVSARPVSGITIPASAVDAIIRRIAMLAHKQPIYFLWRPLLPDPG